MTAPPIFTKIKAAFPTPAKEFKHYLNRKSAAILLSAVFVVAAAWLCVSYAQERSTLASFSPINGDFQSFNSVRRILHGQVPGRDFDIYLGIGPTYLCTLATALAGKHFAASLFGINLLCALAFFFTIWTICRLLRVPLFAKALLVLFFAMWQYENIPAANILRSVAAYWHELFFPGNSVLALRAVLPYLVIGIVGRHLCPGNNMTDRPAMLLGAVTGLAAIWSNDYGPATAFSLALVVILRIRSLPLRLVARRMVIYGLSAFLAGITALLVLLRSGIGNWIGYALGVAEDQFWFFGLSWGEKVFRISDLPVNTLVIAGSVCTCVLLLRMLTRIERDADASFFLILVATGLAGCLTSIGGSNLERYLGPFYLAAVGSLFYLFSDFLDFRLRWQAGVALLVFTGVLVAEAVPASIAQVLSRSAKVRAIWSSKEWRFVPEIGGYLPIGIDKTVDIGRMWAHSNDVTGVVSTYSSLLETVAGRFPSARSDYMIHALGRKARASFISTLDSKEVNRVVTLRESYTSYETWLRRVNWSFYRKLFREWKPYDRTGYLILWTRRDRPLTESPDLKATCAVSEISDRETTVQVDLVAPYHEAYYVDVRLSYSSSWKPNRQSEWVLRKRLTVRDPDSARSSPVGVGGDSYGIPENESEWYVPLEVEPGSPARLSIFADPAGVAKLRVDSCQARPLIRRSEVELAPLDEFRSSSLTDANWTNGIWKKTPEAGFFVADPGELAGLTPGMRLTFTGSGTRKITRIVGEQVWLSGVPLRPAEDGYPNPIRVNRTAPSSPPAGEVDRGARLSREALKPRKDGTAATPPLGELRASSLSDANWKNGIWVLTAEAGFFVPDKRDLLGLTPGMDVTLMGSGTRKITRIIGEQVWLSGPALNPGEDGFPKPIRVNRQLTAEASSAVVADPAAPPIKDSEPPTAQAFKLLLELRKVEAAYAAFRRDTGRSTNQIADLVVNFTAAPGWKGPYLLEAKAGQTGRTNLEGTSFALFGLQIFQRAGGGLSSAGCGSGDWTQKPILDLSLQRCAVYVIVSPVPVEDMIYLKQQVDGVKVQSGDNVSSGRLRFLKNSASILYQLP